MSSTESPNPNPDKVIEPRTELIDFENLKPMHDPNCQHEFVREATSDIPGTYSEVCAKCPVGRIVRA